MRITSKGQVTIPQDIRSRLGLLPGTEVEFAISGESVHLRKASNRRRDRGRTVVNALRGTATTRMSTKEIMALIRDETLEPLPGASKPPDVGQSP